MQWCYLVRQGVSKALIPRVHCVLRPLRLSRSTLGLYQTRGYLQISLSSSRHPPADRGSGLSSERVSRIPQSRSGLAPSATGTRMSAVMINFPTELTDRPAGLATNLDHDPPEGRSCLRAETDQNRSPFFLLVSATNVACPRR